MLPTSYPVSSIRAIAIILAIGALRSMRTQSIESTATFEKGSTVNHQEFLASFIRQISVTKPRFGCI